MRTAGNKSTSFTTEQATKVYCGNILPIQPTLMVKPFIQDVACNIIQQVLEKLCHARKKTLQNLTSTPTGRDQDLLKAKR